MGTCCTSVDENTRLINSKLSEENKKERRTHKILFLGSGGSGKSTIFKQLQWLHLDGFSQEDAIKLQRHIYFQIVHQMKSVIKHYEDKEEKIDDDTLQEAITTVIDHEDERDLTQSLASSIQYIWKNHAKISNVFNDENVLKYQILDESTQHFWNDLNRIKDAQYIPNELDILNVRYRTTGVVEKQFEIRDVSFHVFDVGGQKSERKKWINCFNEVKAVVFVISLSCYNLMMFEDLNKNCMIDALELFDETIHNKYFLDTHIILFLNKKDLFEMKITKIPITVCAAFEDFSADLDPNDFDATTQYIAEKFSSLNRNEKKVIYTHLTYAMDRQNIDKVFLDVKRIVIHTNLAASGFSMH